MCIQCTSGEKYRFIHDGWVACDRDLFEDDVIVHGTKAGEPEDTYYLLKAGAGRKLADDHAWFSVFSRPPRSRLATNRQSFNSNTNRNSNLKHSTSTVICT